jgi:hypothetical protein
VTVEKLVKNTLDLNDGIPDYPQDSTIAHYSSTAIKVNYSFTIMLGGMVTTNQIQKSECSTTICLVLTTQWLANHCLIRFMYHNLSTYLNGFSTISLVPYPPSTDYSATKLFPINYVIIIYQIILNVNR